MAKQSDIIEILEASFREAYLSRGVPEMAADEMARRSLHGLLEQIGGRKWYLPRVSRLEADAKSSRDHAVREAHRRRVHVNVIRRTFRISVSTYYRILKAG